MIIITIPDIVVSDTYELALFKHLNFGFQFRSVVEFLMDFVFCCVVLLR